MISKTKLAERIRRKTHPDIVRTLSNARKHASWNKVAQTISGSRRGYASVNLREIEKASKEGDTVVVLGKVLGTGELTKKVRVAALFFSDSAMKKLKSVKAETVSVDEEISKNPKAEGIIVLK